MLMNKLVYKSISIKFLLREFRKLTLIVAHRPFLLFTFYYLPNLTNQVKSKKLPYIWGIFYTSHG